MSRSTALLIALTLAAMIPVPAQAFDDPGCGGDWSGSKGAECDFVFVGLPVSVFGTALSSGSARVRVWLSPNGVPEVSLAQCNAERSGSTQCTWESPDDTLGNLRNPPGTRLVLQCNVAGRNSGTYFCATGTSES